MTFSVTLNAEFDQFVDELVRSGTYATRGEVIREALQLLKDREFLREHKLRALRKDIAVGQQQLKRGQSKTYNSKNIHLLMESVKREGRRQLAAEKKTRNGSRA